MKFDSSVNFQIVKYVVDVIGFGRKVILDFDVTGEESDEAFLGRKDNNLMFNRTFRYEKVFSAITLSQIKPQDRLPSSK